MEKQKASSGWIELTSLSPDLGKGLREAAVMRTVGTMMMHARTALPDYIALSRLRACQVVPHKGSPYWQVDWVGRDGQLLATFPLPRQIQPLP